MKKILLITFFILFLGYSTFAQEYDHIDGGGFVKRIEYNYDGSSKDFFTGLGRNNVNIKGGVEKMLFGDFNAKAEYFLEPSFEGVSGLRIVEKRDSLKTSYILEVKYISNYKEVWDSITKKYPTIGIPIEIFSSITEEILDAIMGHRTKRI